MDEDDGRCQVVVIFEGGQTEDFSSWYEIKAELEEMNGSIYRRRREQPSRSILRKAGTRRRILLFMLYRQRGLEANGTSPSAGLESQGNNSSAVEIDF